MKTNRFVAAVASLLLAGSAWADVKAAAESAVDSAGKVLTKAGQATRHGLKAAGEGLEEGTKAANRGADKVAKKVGLPGGPPASSPKRMPH
jgi:hypothetical protein